MVMSKSSQVGIASDHFPGHCRYSDFRGSRRERGARMLATVAGG
jgi:hypothetical protein